MALDCNRNQAIVLVGYFPADAVGPRSTQGQAAATSSLGGAAIVVDYRDNECPNCLGGRNVSSANITLTLQSLPSCLVPNGALRVLVEHIPFSGAAALEATTIVLNQRITSLAAGGNVQLMVELGPMDATQITLSGL